MGSKIPLIKKTATIFVAVFFINLQIIMDFDQHH
jgi:hypothetical protein